MKDLKQILQLLKTEVLARKVWPEPEVPLTLEGWLATVDPQDTTRLRKELSQRVALSRVLPTTPIVAVAGLNDQGKSSLVASLLSEQGRRRVLRGTRQAEATSRFTLWLPGKWRQDAELRDALTSGLAEVFGHAPEALPAEETTAHRVQNHHDKLDVPLLGWDEALDEAGFGVLDCPDIQKQAPDMAQDAPERRRLVLERASHLCAATVMVAKMVNAHVKEFHSLCKLLPEMPRFFAFNLARQHRPHVLLEQLQGAPYLADGSPVFVAYDYDLRNYEELTPWWDGNRKVRRELDRRAGMRDRDPGGNGPSEDAGGGVDGPLDELSLLPCFFRLTAHEEESTPDRISEERSLHCAIRGMEPEKLVRAYHVRLQESLGTTVGRVLDFVIEAGRRTDEKIHRACQDAWDACVTATEGQGGQRVLLTPILVERLRTALVDNAPLYIRLNLKLNQWITALYKVVADKATELLPRTVEQISRGVESLKKKAGEFFGKSEPPAEAPLAKRLHQEFRLRWSKLDDEDGSELLREAAERIEERYAEVGAGNLTAADLKEMAQAFWHRAPKGMAAMKLGLAVVAAFALMFLIDPFTGSIILAAKGMALTLPEIFLGLGLSGLAQHACVTQLQKDLEARLGPDQRKRLFEVACDELGLPRLYLDKVPPVVSTPRHVNADGYALNRMNLLRYVIDPEGVARLRSACEKQG